jgi:hypothetical protein
VNPEPSTAGNVDKTCGLALAIDMTHSQGELGKKYATHLEHAIANPSRKT